MTTPLVAVAHGSRDPRSAANVTALLDVVREQRPDLDVRGTFLDLSAPRLTDVLTAVAGSGHSSAVVVPLLLGHAFHAEVDVPGAVRDCVARHPRLAVRTAGVLGPDRRLEEAVYRRLDRSLIEAGQDPDDSRLGVILAGAGSSREPANALVREVAQRWAARRPWAGAEAAFAAAASPDVPNAVLRLRERGARRIAVASWFLAPGLLPDRVYEQTREHATGPSFTANPVIAGAMGDDRGVAELIVDRYTAALHGPVSADTGGAAPSSSASGAQVAAAG